MGEGQSRDTRVTRRHRVIFHVDMDAFFANVEVLDRPELRGKPVIVGGDGARGVVAACTYEARMFGVHSAMPSTVAKRHCPQAIFLPGRFSRYAELSAQLHGVFEDITPLVEGISLDEAFLDVSGAASCTGDGSALAQEIRARVAAELGLPCSVGVGRSKLMAKLASKEAKPRADRQGITPGPGVVVVDPDRELAFLHPLPVRALWGVGPVTGKRLESVGVRTIGQLAELPSGTLRRLVGAGAADHLSALARGEDDRPVVPEREAKSIGHEETFSTDLWDRDELHRRLQRMVEASGTALRKHGRLARTVTVKLKFADFTLITRSHTVPVAIDATPAIGAVAGALLDSVDRDRGIRLLGVSLSGFSEESGASQLAFSFDAPSSPSGATHVGAPEELAPEELVRARLERADLEAEHLQEAWGTVTDAIDAVRARYGGSAVGPASAVGPKGITMRRRGDAQWGPTETIEDDGRRERGV